MNTYLEFCTRVVRETGTFLLEKMDQPHTTKSKTSSIDLVTEIDEQAQAMIVGHIREEFPDHGILAEEDDLNDTDHDYIWIVDPIDGTTNYWHRLPFFTISVALYHHNSPLIGVVYAPRLGEMFCASRGAGSFLNDTPIHVSHVAQLHHAIIATGFPYDRLPGSDNNLTEFRRVMPFVQGIRRFGSASLDLCYVAAGRLDGYWEFHLRPWDSAAGILLVQEAGGTVTTVRPSGEMNGSGGILATNGMLHDMLWEKVLGNA